MKSPIIGINPKLFYGLITGLLCTNAFAVLALLMGGDIAQLTSQKTDITVALYETRIADLRTEVDRLNSRQYARSGDLNLQLQDLASQQEELTVQHQYVRALAQMAQELGIDTTDIASTPPRPQLKTSQLDQNSSGQTASLETVRLKLFAMQQDTQDAITAISTGTQKSTQKLVSVLNSIGIHPDFPSAGATGIGGPFEAIENMPENNSLALANAIVDDFRRFEIARQTLRDAPVHSPLANSARISSSFGARRDPFLDKTGFHSGMDFAAGMGTPVKSAGAGKVIFAGDNGGYGNMVEIKHDDGLVTRYAHLSSILVSKGQTIASRTTIGLVGSTGRSTGPHLHFEVRQSDTPLNPQKFLTAGAQLKRFM